MHADIPEAPPTPSGAGAAPPPSSEKYKPMFPRGPKPALPAVDEDGAAAGASFCLILLYCVWLRLRHVSFVHCCWRGTSSGHVLVADMDFLSIASNRAVFTKHICCEPPRWPPPVKRHSSGSFLVSSNIEGVSIEHMSHLCPEITQHLTHE